MLDVYAITDSPYPPPRPGPGGAELRAIGEGGLFAVCGEQAGDEPEISEETLWAHEEVVERLMEEATVLPLRLGSTVDDEEALLALLRERREEFTAALERVRGAVEVGVRALLAAPQPEVAAATAPGGSAADPAGPGTSYILGRMDRERATAAAAARVHEPLARLARESADPASSPRGSTLTASYLVDLEALDAFRARVEELSDELDGGTIVCTGPWPPYSFCSGEPGR
jgi:hypothetical protein